MTTYKVMLDLLNPAVSEFVIKNITSFRRNFVTPVKILPSILIYIHTIISINVAGASVLIIFLCNVIEDLY